MRGEFLQAGLADELLPYIAPVLLGPQGASDVELPELTDLAQGKRFTIVETCAIGADLRLRLQPA